MDAAITQVTTEDLIATCQNYPATSHAIECAKKLIARLGAGAYEWVKPVVKAHKLPTAEALLHTPTDSASFPDSKLLPDGLTWGEHKQGRCGGSAYCPYCEAQAEAEASAEPLYKPTAWDALLTHPSEANAADADMLDRVCTYLWNDFMAEPSPSARMVKYDAYYLAACLRD